MRGLGKAGLAVALAGLLGCSLLVDTSDLDAGCPSGTKLCAGDGCVAVDDPAYGCKRDSCIPCSDIRNAVAVCVDFECEGQCLDGFGCAGCLVDLLTDEDNCGGCCSPGELCPFQCGDHEVCKEGRCVAPFG
jgi:hypothetical protein